MHKRGETYRTSVEVAADKNHAVPSSTKKRSLRRNVTLGGAVLTTLAVLLMVLMVMATPTTAQVPSRRAAPQLYSVSSSKELRRVCHEQAPELEKTSWYRTFMATGKDVQVTNTGRRAFAYLFSPYPVCVHLDTGRMFAEHAASRINAIPESQHRLLPENFTTVPVHDLEELFAYMKRSGSANDSTVKLIPAMGVMPFGMFMATHMWHLIHDALAPLAQTVSRVIPEFWDVPRQGVILDQVGVRWTDRGGDLPDKMRLSAYILNGFSTFTANTSSSDPNAPPVPAFARTALVAHLVDNPPPVLDGSVPDLVSRTACFCQNAFLHSDTGADIPTTESTIVVQDRTAVSFGAPPYRPLSQESVWAIERQRVERYPPWARQFWPSSGTSSDYQPRVLFIHRVRRTIANVGGYVTAMREMGFRVEEVYLEKLPMEQQYYLGRYADVVVGMHGLGVGHALWMNRYPTGCRTVIEFRLWAGAGIPLGLEQILADAVHYHYVAPQPIDVVFGPTVKNPWTARQEIEKLGHSGYTHPGWDDQVALFNDTEVLAMLKEVKQHLATCLATNAL